MTDNSPQLPPPLNTPLVSSQYDDRHKIIIFRYYKELTSESTRQMYQYAMKSIEERGFDFVRGVIYDFTDVKRFTLSNATATQKGSLTINAKVDFSRLPVAMVAKTLLQEQHLSIIMSTTPGTTRKKIVHSIQEGVTFIEQWLRQNQPKPTEVSEKEQ